MDAHFDTTDTARESSAQLTITPKVQFVTAGRPTWGSSRKKTQAPTSLSAFFSVDVACTQDSKQVAELREHLDSELDLYARECESPRMNLELAFESEKYRALTYLRCLSTSKTVYSQDDQNKDPRSRLMTWEWGKRIFDPSTRAITRGRLATDLILGDPLKNEDTECDADSIRIVQDFNISSGVDLPGSQLHRELIVSDGVDLNTRILGCELLIKELWEGVVTAAKDHMLQDPKWTGLIVSTQKSEDGVSAENPSEETAAD